MKENLLRKITYLAGLKEEQELSGYNFKIRPYTTQELKEEIGELRETPASIYPKDIKAKILEKLNDISKGNLKGYLTYLDLKSEVDNTEAFEPDISLKKIKSYYEEDPEYIERFKSILKAKKIPPPIVISYMNKMRLLGGNRRATMLALKANQKGIKRIPVILVKI